MFSINQHNGVIRGPSWPPLDIVGIFLLLGRGSGEGQRMSTVLCVSWFICVYKCKASIVAQLLQPTATASVSWHGPQLAQFRSIPQSARKTFNSSDVSNTVSLGGGEGKIMMASSVCFHLLQKLLASSKHLAVYYEVNTKAKLFI